MVVGCLSNESSEELISVNVCLIEPFFSGSHKQWAEGYQKCSKNRIELLTLPGRHWKWRMEGAAIHFADQMKALDVPPEVILTTDMLDVAVFRSLIPERLKSIPILVYFHENQFAYPNSTQNTREEFQYTWKNFTSALTADFLCFNSAYNRNSFVEGLRLLLDRLPDYQPKSKVDEILEKSQIIPISFEFVEQPSRYEKVDVPTILWNHRWEYDKGPSDFFELLFELKQEEFDFKLIVLGESYSRHPEIFDRAEMMLKDETLHWGYVDPKEEYRQLLAQADVLPVTSYHDFFGISVVEAIQLGVHPLLPNKLAYPELVDPLRFPECYYSDLTDLKTRIKSFESSSRIDLSRFHWNDVAPQLDSVLSQMLHP